MAAAAGRTEDCPGTGKHAKAVATHVLKGPMCQCLPESQCPNDKQQAEKDMAAAPEFGLVQQSGFLCAKISVQQQKWLCMLHCQCSCKFVKMTCVK